MPQWGFQQIGKSHLVGIYAFLHHFAFFDTPLVSIIHIGKVFVAEHQLQGVGTNIIVAGIEELTKLSLGLRDALVHGMVNAVVGLTHPIGDVGTVGLYELAAAIVGTSINYNPLKITEGLCTDAFNSLSQSFEIIVIDGDY